MLFISFYGVCVYNPVCIYNMCVCMCVDMSRHIYIICKSLEVTGKNHWILRTSYFDRLWAKGDHFDAWAKGTMDPNEWRISRNVKDVTQPVVRR